jgi:hypothetical protein
MEKSRYKIFNFWSKGMKARSHVFEFVYYHGIYFTKSVSSKSIKNLVRKRKSTSNYGCQHLVAKFAALY